MGDERRRESEELLAGRGGFVPVGGDVRPHQRDRGARGRAGQSLIHRGALFDQPDLRHKVRVARLRQLRKAMPDGAASSEDTACLGRIRPGRFP